LVLRVAKLLRLPVASRRTRIAFSNAILDILAFALNGEVGSAIDRATFLLCHTALSAVVKAEKRVAFADKRAAVLFGIAKSRRVWQPAKPRHFTLALDLVFRTVHGT
jgi:hypothetical protein